MSARSRLRDVVVLVLVLATALPACSGSPTTTSADATVPPLHPSVDGYPETVLMLRPPDGGVGDATTIAVKVADTPERRSHGLMEVTDLPEGTGMLFVFQEPSGGGFWMKDTLIPLDIAFIDDGEVVTVRTMTPCEADPCTVYEPDATYTEALEVPAGWFSRIGLAEGWSVEETRR